MKNCVVVGDSADDRCIVGHAGKGFAFVTNDEILKQVAYKSIKERNFELLLELA
ncbi:MAG: hypothetical protein WDO19_23145 [Bacteroidota bacterium]